MHASSFLGLPTSIRKSAPTWVAVSRPGSVWFVDLAGMGEFGFIDRIAGRVPADADALGIGDDAAVVEMSAGSRLVATVDTLVSDVHFRWEWSSPADVGWKSVVVNVSDLAAMGARPRWLLVALAAPGDTSTDVLDGLYTGMTEAADAYGAAVVGGDTVRAPVVVISVTALGEVDRPPLTRSGARPGDVLAVTGPLGRAAAGLNLLMSQKTEGLTPEDAIACMGAHRRPRARVDAGLALVRWGRVHAAMDVSDGLLSDVRRIADASGVGVELDRDAVPVAPEAARVAGVRGWDAFAMAAGGGEDFELLVALDPQDVDASPVPLHVVGRVTDGGLALRTPDGTEPLPEGGFEHFR